MAGDPSIDSELEAAREASREAAARTMRVASLSEHMRPHRCIRCGVQKTTLECRECKSWCTDDQSDALGDLRIVYVPRFGVINAPGFPGVDGRRKLVGLDWHVELDGVALYIGTDFDSAFRWAVDLQSRDVARVT